MKFFWTLLTLLAVMVNFSTPQLWAQEAMKTEPAVVEDHSDDMAYDEEAMLEESAATEDETMDPAMDASASEETVIEESEVVSEVKKMPADAVSSETVMEEAMEDAADDATGAGTDVVPSENLPAGDKVTL